MECSSIKLSSLLRAKREPEMVHAPVRGVRALLRWAKFSFAHQKRTRNGSRAGGAGQFSLSVKWLCAPRGPEVGRGVSNPPSLPLDSTLPATS